MKQIIVDSHIHFWDPEQLQYDWLASVPAINKAFLPADLMKQAANSNLEKIVFVQCDCVPEQGIAEAEWVSSLAEKEPRIQAIVAFAPLEQGDSVRDYLQKLSRIPLVKGIRRLIQSEEAGFCLQADFVSGVQLLSEFGYSFDICVMHRQLKDVIKLVAQCPNVSFVLDHLGKPGIKDALLEPWQANISELAQFQNVSCKISGLVTEADIENWTPENLQPYVDHALHAFGPDRVMYGGDWPVSLLATSYQSWLEVLDSATMHLSSHDKHKLFYQNANAFYQLSEK